MLSRSVAISAARDLEWNMRLGERSLGAHDPLRDGCFRYNERARDLVGGETAEQTQGERDAGFGGENWVTRGEHESQQVVANVVVERCVEVGHAHLLLGVQLVPNLLVLALDALAAPVQVDGAVLGGGHEPGAGIVRHSCLRPPLERSDKGVLRQVFGDADVTRDASETRNESWRLDSPDGIDGSVDVGHDSGLKSRLLLTLSGIGGLSGGA